MSEPFTVTLDEDSFRSYRTDIPSLEVSVTKENLLKWYQQMATMRRMEQAADALYRAKMIRGFCHLATGQVSLTLAHKFSSKYALTRRLCAIIVHDIGSCFRRVPLRDGPRRQAHHLIPLSSLRRPPRWHHYWSAC